MPTAYPGGVDTFVEPSAPEATPLSSSGTGTRNHLEHHRDLGDAVEALQANVALKSHAHDGTATARLLQVNTHQSADTDTGPTAIHHTLGTGPNQAARGDHKHTAADISGISASVCTSATRPASPTPGQVILETDTCCQRAWLKLPWEPSARWVLLTSAVVPICRLVQGTPQQIAAAGNVIEWRAAEQEDTFGMFDSATSLTDVVVREPGLYSIEASIAWDPSQLYGDRARVQLLRNAVATYRQQYEFVRGNLFTPGFSQSVNLACKMRFDPNDRLAIVASHNGAFAQFTYCSTSARVDTWLDIAYISP